MYRSLQLEASRCIWDLLCRATVNLEFEPDPDVAAYDSLPRAEYVIAMAGSTTHDKVNQAPRLTKALLAVLEVTSACLTSVPFNGALVCPACCIYYGRILTSIMDILFIFTGITSGFAA